MKYLSKVLYVLSGSRTKLTLLFLGFILCSILEAIGIGLLSPFMNLASNPNLDRLPSSVVNIAAKFNIDSYSEVLLTLGLTIIAFFCVKSVIYFIAQAYIIHFSSDYKAKLASRLLKSYLSVKYEFHLNRNTASLIKNIVLETNHFYHFCILPLLTLTSNIIVISFLFLLLAITDFRLLAMILAIMLPIFVLFGLLKSKFEEWGRISSQSQQGMVRTINHAMGGLKETRVIGCEPYFEAKMEQYVKRYARAATFSQSAQMLPKITIETALIVLIVSFLIVSQLSSTRNMQEITGILGVFAVAAMRLIPSTSRVLESIGLMQKGTYALDMLYADLKEIDKQPARSSKLLSNHVDTNSSIETIKEQKASMKFRSRLELSNVTYSYPASSILSLDKISLNINKGESIALIGKSGAGKTTLVDIVLGLLEPQKGDILVDGVSIYQNLRSWQNSIGYIPQSIFLTDNTVERNIAFGIQDSAIDRGKMDRVIKAAQLSELIEQLPQGIKTQVGERGIRLSGGQRQRIGIARALYHEREILVLDEATAALDNETEHLIGQAINSLAGNKTLIIIAHRLSTVENCDRIYLLEKGCVVNSGSYQEVVGTGLTNAYNATNSTLTN